MNKTALITGASGGLGEEFARICAADKYNLVLVARSEEKLNQLAAELSDAHGIKAVGIAIDLSTAKGVGQLVQELQKRETLISLLVNNAGFGIYGAFAGQSPEEIASMMHLNMNAPAMLTRKLLPNMIQQQHGRILNVSSIAAFQPGPLMAVYYASKAFVLNFSIALHRELRGTGVTATCLCPGPTKTGFESRAGLEESKLFQGNSMDAHDVALIGYRACINGKPLVVPGIKNKLLVFASRFASRPLAAAIAQYVQAERIS